LVRRDDGCSVMQAGSDLPFSMIGVFQVGGTTELRYFD